MGISRFASVLGGVVCGFLGQPEFDAIVERDLAEGQHRNPTERLDYFTTAYFHHPDEPADEPADELADEMREAGGRLEGIFAVEGQGWLIPGIVKRWESGASRDRILAALRAIETEPSLLGMSAHIMAVGRKA